MTPPEGALQFEGESGVDAGGLTVELYQQLFATMFSGSCALMESVGPEDGGPDTPRFLPALDTGSAVDCSMQSLRMYEGVGRFLMKSVFDGQPVPCLFSLAVFKFLLDLPVTLNDLQVLCS